MRIPVTSGHVPSGAEYERLNLEQDESETDHFTEHRYSQFADHLPTSAVKVLDVGCNTGRGRGRVLKTARPDLRITGLDVVPARLENVPADVYSSTVLGMSTSIPVDDGEFDAIVAGEFIEHLAPADVWPTLCEFFRVLDLGGRLLLTTPNPNDLKRRIRGESVLGGAHLSQHHARALRTSLHMVGFSRVHIEGSGRTSLKLGRRFPLLCYGSYHVRADKI